MDLDAAQRNLLPSLQTQILNKIRRLPGAWQQNPGSPFKKGIPQQPEKALLHALVGQGNSITTKLFVQRAALDVKGDVLASS